jgi:hypothetical protein
MQLHTFYPSAIEDSYRADPGLQNRSFDEQTDVLLRSGFTGIHLFAPYLHELGWECRQIVPNNLFAQAQWLREQKIRVPGNQIQPLEVTKMQVDAFKPDVLYLGETVAMDSKFIRTLTHRPAVIAGWRAANIPEGTDWSEYDIIFSNLDALREKALTLGARSTEYFFPGFPEWIYHEVKDVKPQVDVTFCGQVTIEQHRTRSAYIDFVAREAASASPFSLQLFLSGVREAVTPAMIPFMKPSRYGVAMHEALRLGRISFDARGDIGFVGANGVAVDLAKKQTSNMRIFETTGTGVFLLTEYHDNLAKFFLPEKEIGVFENQKDLAEKIRYYLKHPDIREEIAQAGQRRCFKDYSMAKRCRDLDAILRRYLVQKDSARYGNYAASLPEALTAARAIAANLQFTPPADFGSIASAMALLSSEKNTAASSALRSLLSSVLFGRATMLLSAGKSQEATDCLKAQLKLNPFDQNAGHLLYALTNSSGT